MRFNLVQLPLGAHSTIQGLRVTNRTGVSQGCSYEPCEVPVPVVCRSQFECVPIFERAYCACPVGTRFEGGTCVDIPECDYGVCLNGGVCAETYGCQSPAHSTT